MSPKMQSRAWCQPRLAYDDPSAALEFLKTAFGLREQNRMEGPDDTFMAWLDFGNNTMMIGRSGPERHNLYSPRETGKPTAEMNVAVNDIDAHFHRAKAAGAVIRTALVDAPWGYRHYEAVDPEGHGWHFMKPLEGSTPREGYPGRAGASPGVRRRAIRSGIPDPRIWVSGAWPDR